MVWERNKEAWKLKLIDSNGKPVKGEVLASMYDASLDSFISGRTKWNIDLREKPWYYFYPAPNLSTINHSSFGRSTSYNFNIPQIYGSARRFFEVARLETFGYDFVNSERKQYIYLANLETKLPVKPQDSRRIEAHGMVLDEEGLPIPGATIYLESENNGPYTDLDGEFVISAHIGDLLHISA